MRFKSAGLFDGSWIDCQLQSHFMYTDVSQFDIPFRLIQY